MTEHARNRAEQARDLCMGLILLFWVVYGAAAVIQLFTSGAQVLDSLPPFYFWGVPIAPYTALYAPWKIATQPPDVTPPEPPPAPEAAR